MAGWGRSATLAGNVIGSLPDGLTAPNRILAMAVAPRCPGNQASSTALTFASHGINCVYAKKLKKCLKLDPRCPNAAEVRFGARSPKRTTANVLIARKSSREIVMGSS